MDFLKSKWAPVIIAVIIALIALIWYITSGRGSLDAVSRDLVKDEQITSVDTKDPKRIIVRCKNGESYEIVFKEGQQNYKDLIFSNCGGEGTVEEK